MNIAFQGLKYMLFMYLFAHKYMLFMYLFAHKYMHVMCLFAHREIALENEFFIVKFSC